MKFRGLSGEIIVMWWHGSIRVDMVHNCEQHVALIILEQTEGPWFLSGIYASIDIAEGALVQDL